MRTMPGNDILQLKLFKDNRSVVLFMTSFFLIMGSQLLVSVIPEFMLVFNVNESSAGLIISFFTLPPIFLSPFIGKYAGIYGRKIFMVSGTLLFGIAGLIPAVLEPSFKILLIFRLLQGIGFAAAMPLTITLIGDLYESSEEVAAQGFRVFFIGMGGFIFPIVGSSLAAVKWNYPFFSYLIAIPFAYFIWTYLPDFNREEVDTDKSGIWQGLKLLHNPALFMVLMAGLIRFFLAFSIRVYLPFFIINKFGSSLVMGGILVGLMAITISIVSFQAGLIAEKLGMIKPVIMGFSVFAFFNIILPFSPSIFFVFILTLLLGLGDGFLVPFQKSLVTQNVSKEIRATVVSFNSSMQAIGKTISPVTGLIVIKFGLNWAFWSMALVALVPLIYFILNRELYNIMRRD